MIVKLTQVIINAHTQFESSVNSYDSQTTAWKFNQCARFESSVNSYDSQTLRIAHWL